MIQICLLDRKKFPFYTSNKFFFVIFFSNNIDYNNTLFFINNKLDDIYTYLKMYCYNSFGINIGEKDGIPYKDLTLYGMYIYQGDTKRIKKDFSSLDYCIFNDQVHCNSIYIKDSLGGLRVRCRSFTLANMTTEEFVSYLS